MTEIMKRLRQVHGDGKDAREAATHIRRLRLIVAAISINRRLTARSSGCRSRSTAGRQGSRPSTAS